MKHFCHLVMHRVYINGGIFMEILEWLGVGVEAAAIYRGEAGGTGPVFIKR